MPVYTPLALVFGDVFTAARAATFETQFKLAKERERDLGGIPDVGEGSTTYVDVPGAIIVDLVEATTAQLHVMAFVSGGTGTFRLWNITAAAEVASSETTFTETSATLKKTGNLELAAASTYKLQVKISSNSFYAVVYGGKLVTR
jgi:hypothetical protein